VPHIHGDACALALDMDRGGMCVCMGVCNGTCDVFADTWLSHYKQLLTLQRVRFLHLAAPHCW
jgi:hypothetical protein